VRHEYRDTTRNAAPPTGAMIAMRHEYRDTTTHAAQPPAP
jgi:hypothetical protein